jgi:hypothetical protein
MPVEPSWLGRIWEYLSAIGIYWWATLAVLLTVERLAERGFPGFWKARVDPWFTPVRRKQTLTIFVVLAFLLGNFRAFDDERREIDRLRLQLTQAPSSPTSSERNPDGLYQFGEEVATVAGASISQGNSLITFQMVRSAGKLDAAREVEYREFVLSCSGLPPAPPPDVMAGVVSSVSTGAQCAILSKR